MFGERNRYRSSRGDIATNSPAKSTNHAGVCGFRTCSPTSQWPSSSCAANLPDDDYFWQRFPERHAVSRLTASIGLLQSSSRMDCRQLVSALSLTVAQSCAFMSVRLSFCSLATHSLVVRYFSLGPMFLQRSSRSHRALAMLATAMA